MESDLCLALTIHLAKFEPDGSGYFRNIQSEDKFNSVAATNKHCTLIKLIEGNAKIVESQVNRIWH